MKLRRLPYTPERQREGPRTLPDEIHLRSYRTNWGAPRYLVEARAQGRPLGDRDFATLEDAREFAGMEAKWNGAKLIDQCRPRKGA